MTAPYERLAEMTDLTLDAYTVLVRAILDIIDEVSASHANTLTYALKESTMMLNFGASS